MNHALRTGLLAVLAISLTWFLGLVGVVVWLDNFLRTLPILAAWRENTIVGVVFIVLFDSLVLATELTDKGT